MVNQNYSKYKFLLLILSAIIIFYLVPAGLIGLKNVPYTGFQEGGKVDLNSPAEKAGLQNGDILISINSLKMNDLRTFFKNYKV